MKILVTGTAHSIKNDVPGGINERIMQIIARRKPPNLNAK